MWIRLLKPYAVSYPPRTEPVGSIHSVGGPKGAQLVASGIAEETLSPPEHARAPTDLRSDDRKQTKLDRTRAIELLVRAGEVSRRK